MHEQDPKEIILDETTLKANEIRILIIDDEVHLAENLRTLLLQGGYSVDIATTGSEAISKLNDQHCHIVITDMVMPEFDGNSVMEFVKKHAPETLLIVITGYASTESAVSAMRKGAYDYIIKPFDFDYLMFTVERAVDKIKLETQVKINYQKVLEYAKQLEEANLKLMELSITDGLTKLYNQTYFHKCLQKEAAMALRYYAPLSCVMLDIDNFKQVNDNFGHPFGDRVLRELADIIRESVRETDVASRYGGDEFFILLPQTDISGTHILAERLRQKICTRKFRDADRSTNLTVSIGISAFSASMAEDKSRLLTLTDRAMYNAKMSGKNRIAMCLDESELDEPVELDIKQKRTRGLENDGPEK